MSSSYRNPWHRPHSAEYGPARYSTSTTPTEYRGFLIYRRLPQVFDVVRDGVCLAQRAGINGAKRWIDAQPRRSRARSAA